MTDQDSRSGFIPWTPEVPVNGEASRVLERAGVLEDSQRELVLHQAKTVLSKCVPPTEDAGTITGLVIGQFKSGTTLSYTTLAALAHDNGYRGVILLVGTYTDLGDQDTDRLFDDLNAEESPVWEVCRLVQGNQVAIDEDVAKIRQIQCDQANKPGTHKRTLVFTLQKNRANLDRLSGLLGRLGTAVERFPFIIIDDESEPASLNQLCNPLTTGSLYLRTGPVAQRLFMESWIRDEESATSAAVRRLRDCVPQHSYLQYTAPPHANELISLADNLSPNFVELLEPGTGNCVVDEFSGRPGNHRRHSEDLWKPEPWNCDVDANSCSDIYRGLDIYSKGKATWLIEERNGNFIEIATDELLESLRCAFAVFVVGTAARIAEGDTGIKSMLIHTHAHKLFQGECSNYVSLLTERWATALGDESGESEAQRVHAEFAYHYNGWTDHYNGWTDSNIEELIDPIRYVLSELCITVLDSCSSKDTEVNWGSASVHILVGDQTLERRFTVKGLTVCYLSRHDGVEIAEIVDVIRWLFSDRKELLPGTRIYVPRCFTGPSYTFGNGGDRPSVQGAFNYYAERDRAFRYSVAEFAKSGVDFSKWSRQFIINRAYKPTLEPARGVGRHCTELRDWTQLVPDFDNADSIESFIEAADLLCDSTNWRDPKELEFRDYHTDKDGSKFRHHQGSSTIRDVLEALLRLRSPKNDQYTALLELVGIAERRGSWRNACVVKIRRGDVGVCKGNFAGGYSDYNLHNPYRENDSYPLNSPDTIVHTPADICVQIYRYQFERSDGSKTPAIPAFAFYLSSPLRPDQGYVHDYRLCF